MDHCASILMAFPPDHLRADDVAGFEAALRTHMNRLENLFKDQSAAIGTNAVQLLNVSLLTWPILSPPSPQALPPVLLGLSTSLSCQPSHARLAD